MNSVNKWLRMDEDALGIYLHNNTPYLEQHLNFIISILKICMQTLRISSRISIARKNIFSVFEGYAGTDLFIKSENIPTLSGEKQPLDMRHRSISGYLK